MNKNKRNKRDMIDDKAFIKAITRFRNGDQYLKEEVGIRNNNIYSTLSFLNNLND